MGEWWPWTRLENRNTQLLNSGSATVTWAGLLKSLFAPNPAWLCQDPNLQAHPCSDLVYACITEPHGFTKASTEAELWDCLSVFMNCWQSISKYLFLLRVIYPLMFSDFYGKARCPSGIFVFCSRKGKIVPVFVIGVSTYASRKFQLQLC